jgi:hypothetical protein
MLQVSSDIFPDLFSKAATGDIGRLFCFPSYYRSFTSCLLENIYKNLTASEKKGELTNAWRNYTHKSGISPKKMATILERYGFDVKLLVTYKK